MADDPSESLLTTFATTLDNAERVSTLSELMTVKAIPKRADDERFGTGLSTWVEIANTSSTEPRIRLLAICELIRATQQLRKRQPALIELLAPAFAQPLPPLLLLEDAEQRLNVARACSLTQTPWLQAYRAQSVASEIAQKPRTELLDGMTSAASSVAEVLDLLANAFEGLQPDTENPAESAAKRLSRTLEVFRSTVLSSLLESGPDVGKRLDLFVRSAFSSTGKPKDETVQIELTSEVAQTLHALVRSRFSLATEPQTFLALQYCRAFFPGISWPQGVQPHTDLLVGDVSEALVMLGRMGLPNQDLLHRLELTCGIKERAAFVATQLADKHPELDEAIRNWLRTGRMVTTIGASEALQESRLATVDEALGLALIEARTYKSNSDVADRIANSLEILDPVLLPGLNSLVGQSLAMLNAIEDLAKRRDLELYGSVGDELEYAPKYFDALGTLRANRGVVRRPAVVRKATQGGAGAVVKKGLME